MSKWTIAKWACLGIGGLFFLMSLFADAAPAGAQAAGMACFFGIVSRIMQAEAQCGTQAGS